MDDIFGTFFDGVMKQRYNEQHVVMRKAVTYDGWEPVQVCNNYEDAKGLITVLGKLYGGLFQYKIVPAVGV